MDATGATAMNAQGAQSPEGEDVTPNVGKSALESGTRGNEGDAVAPPGSDADESAMDAPSPHPSALVTTAAPPAGFSATKNYARDRKSMKTAHRSQNTESWLTFGPSATLRPEPRKVAAQLQPDYVSDSEVDWLELGELSVRAGSVRGHLHRYEGTVRQDSFAIGSRDQFLVLAVSDGVGTASHSHLGSRFLTQRAVSDDALLADATALLGDGTEVQPGDLTLLKGALEQVGLLRGLEPRDLSSTLLVAAVLTEPQQSPQEQTVYLAALWSLGDSSFLRITDCGVEQLLPPNEHSEGPLVNSSTQSLPLQTAATVWVECFSPGETLALVTDGVANIVASNSDFRSHLQSQWDSSAPSPAQLLETLDATVKSFDDDRTMVAVRFPKTDL